MTDLGYNYNDLFRVYESFIDEKLRHLTKYKMIKSEFQEFKNELASKINELGDAEFGAYAEQRKNFIREKTRQIRASKNCENLENIEKSKSEFALFDILKIFTDDKFGLEDYLSSFRVHNPQDLVKDWEGDKEEFKLEERAFVSDLRDTSTLPQILAGSSHESVVQFLVKKEKKRCYRILSLDPDSNYLEKLFFGIFFSIIERKLDTRDAIVDYFTNLYNISHHFGLKTQYFLLFNNLCKYFQFILHSVIKCQIPDPALYQASIINLISKTAHKRKIVKGIKHLMIEIAKIVLNFTSEQNLSTILSLYSDEPVAYVKQEIEGFLAGVSSNYSGSMNELRSAADRETLGRLIPIYCFCFGIDLNCVFFLENSDSQTINYTQNGSPSYPMILHSVSNPYFFILLYGEGDRELLARLSMNTRSKFNLDDFFSVSEHYIDPNKEKERRNDHFRTQPQPGVDYQHARRVISGQEGRDRSLNKLYHDQMDDGSNFNNRDVIIENPSKVELSKNNITYSNSPISSPTMGKNYPEGVQAGPRIENSSHNSGFRNDTNHHERSYNTSSKKISVPGSSAQHFDYEDQSRPHQSHQNQLSNQGSHMDVVSEDMKFEVSRTIENSLSELADLIADNTNKVWEI